MKPESRPSSEQGLASGVNLAGAFDHEFTQTPLAKHASFSGSLVAEVSSLCISSVSLITLDFPQPNRETAHRLIPYFSRTALEPIFSASFISPTLVSLLKRLGLPESAVI
jgi:hypothetical protein